MLEVAVCIPILKYSYTCSCFSTPYIGYSVVLSGLVRFCDSKAKQ